MDQVVLSGKICGLIKALKQPEENEESFLERLLKDYYESDPIQGIFKPKPFSI